MDAGRPPSGPAGGRAAVAATLTWVEHWPQIWAAVVLQLSILGEHWPCDRACLTPAAMIRAAGLLPVFLLVAPRRIRALVWVLVAVAAATGGSLAAGRLLVRPPAVATDLLAPSGWACQEGLAAMRVTARPRPSAAGGWSAPARLLSWTPAAELPAGPRCGDGVFIRGRGAAPPLGAVLGGRWRLAPPKRAAVDGGFDEAVWLRGRNLSWVAAETESPSQRTDAAGAIARVGRLQAHLQAAARERLAAGLPAREAALAAAVLLGGGADPGLREPFVRLGLAHLFALSGLHVGIVAGLLLLVLRCAVRGPGGQLALSALALAGYVVLVDAPDSVVRAVGLVLVTLALKAAGRALDGLRILGLLFWLNVLWRPESLFDVGFRLSYLAAGGILGAQRLLASDLAAWPQLWRWPARGLLVSLAAQTTTLPVLAASFGMLPIAAPPVNLLAVPMFSLAASCFGAGLLLACAWPWAGHGLLACGWLLVRPLQAGAAAAGTHLEWLELGLPVWGPWRVLVYAGWLALLVVWLRRARGRRRLLALPMHLALLPVAAWSPAVPGGGGAMQIWQYAVSQGDCALMTFPDGWTCLLDTGGGRRGGGPFARDVWPHLRRQGRRRLDAVVLTHGHDDHTGGAGDVATRLEVGSWFAGGRAAVPAGRRLAAGDTLHAAGDWTLVCVHPPAADWQARNENDYSISLALCRRDSMYALWTGDLEASGERVLLPRLPPVKRDGLDVWKAGHHGSRTSGSADFLAQTRPRLVVISCGVANRHRHPSHASYGEAEILRTDLQATVHLAWDRRGRLRWRALYPLQRALVSLP